MKLLSEAFSPDVLAELGRPIQSYDPRHAEISLLETPGWCVVEVHEPLQRDILNELAARRFGVFVPEMDRTELRRGRKVERVLPLFPGYIFVFVWGVGAHWSRITTIRGVVRILGLMSDAEVDHIRKIENSERPLRGASKRKKRSRGKARDDDVIAVYPWSPFEDRLLELDSEARNQTLQKALGLCS